MSLNLRFVRGLAFLALAAIQVHGEGGQGDPQADLKALRAWVSREAVPATYPEAELLNRFQRAVGPWLQEALADPACPARGRRLERWLAHRLGGTTWKADPLHPAGAIRFEVLVATGGWRVVILTTGIPCGADAQVYVFRQGRMVWQDDPVVSPDLSEARGPLNCLVLPKEGALRLVLFHVSSRCVSAYREGLLRVVEFGAQTRVRFSLASPLWINDEGPALQAVNGDTFELSLVDQSLDPGRGRRGRRLRFRIEPSQVVRVPPFATTPEDLVEEWVRLPWSEAQALMAAKEPEAFRTLHARCQEGLWELVAMPVGGRLARSRWDSHQQAWRVELEGEHGSIRFIVKRIQGALRLQDITPS